MMENRVKAALDAGTGRGEFRQGWSHFGRYNPFRIMRQSLGTLLVFLALMFLLGTDRVKGDAIKVAAIAAMGIGVSFLIERVTSPPGAKQ